MNGMFHGICKESGSLKWSADLGGTMLSAYREFSLRISVPSVPCCTT
jgi:hypothetical protein